MGPPFSLPSSASFLGQTVSLTSKPHLLPSPLPSPRTPSAKFDLPSLLGGRGLCNGEQNLQLELRMEPISPQPDIPSPSSTFPLVDPPASSAFNKELFGLTGGFPGGERGLQEFLIRNPPPTPADNSGVTVPERPRPPELPLLLPGMIVIVRNEKNPFYKYCGIVQRVTDGKAGVLFEGGNWDKLLTFNLEELERREKGPPMVNPKSAVLESTVGM